MIACQGEYFLSCNNVTINFILVTSGIHSNIQGMATYKISKFGPFPVICKKLQESSLEVARLQCHTKVSGMLLVSPSDDKLLLSHSTSSSLNILDGRTVVGVTKSTLLPKHMILLRIALDNAPYVVGRYFMLLIRNIASTAQASAASGLVDLILSSSLCMSLDLSVLLIDPSTPASESGTGVSGKLKTTSKSSLFVTPTTVLPSRILRELLVE